MKIGKKPKKGRTTEADATKSLTHSRPAPTKKPPTERPTSQTASPKSPKKPADSK